MKREPVTMINMSFELSELDHENLLNSNNKKIDIEIPPKIKIAFLIRY